MGYCILLSSCVDVLNLCFDFESRVSAVFLYVEHKVETYLMLFVKVETYPILIRGRNIGRARPTYKSSTVETYPILVEKKQNISRA